MRVLICGSRDFPDKQIVFNILDIEYYNSERGLVVIHGACNTELDTRETRRLGEGADAFAHEWCLMMQDDLVIEKHHPADWKQYGRSAGYRRNAEMLNEKPDKVFGFMNHGSNGTTNMLNLAHKAGIKTYRIQEWQG